MIYIDDENMNYNIEYLVCVPKKESSFLDEIEYTLSNTCIFDPEKQEVERIIDFCKKNKVKKVILINYIQEYDRLITGLDECGINTYIYVLTELGTLSNYQYRNIFNGVMHCNKYNQLKGIAFADKNFEAIFKTKTKTFYLPLDYPVSKSDKNNKKTGIGILSSQVNPMHSFFNSLSATKLNSETANICRKSRATKEFVKTYNIKIKNNRDEEEIIENSSINVYVNFTDNNYKWFFKSMDEGIPCIIGNQQIIPTNEKLFDLITVKSDDDIIEIAEKIKYAKNHRTEIIKQYSRFRKKYSEIVKEKRKKFLPEFSQENKNETGVLLSVIVPIYNVENYLRDAVKSIIHARIQNMEIILINDGSTDNSGTIAKSLQKKYPKQIRYIEQPNRGLGNVRNVGLKEAKGKYITSVDSDDAIASRTFKESLKYLKNNVDMVIYDWLSVDASTRKKYITSAKDGINNKKNNFEDFLYASIAPSTCNKIIKKSLYEKLGFEFIEARYEDLSLNPLLIMKAKDIAYIPKPYYIYNLRKGSIMRAKNNGVDLDMIRSLKVLDKRISKCYSDYENYEELYYYIFFWRIEDIVINHFYENLNKLTDIEEANFYKEFIPLYKKIYSTRGVKKYLTDKPKEVSDFFKKRNDAIMKKDLRKFIEENDKIIKLNAGNIYGLSEIAI